MFNKQIKQLQFSKMTNVRDVTSINDTINIDELINLLDRKPLPVDGVEEEIVDGLLTALDQYDVKSDDFKQIKSIYNDKYKMLLPAVIISGTSFVGHKAEDVTYNGCFQFDVDFKTKTGEQQASKLFNDLIRLNLPYIPLLFISPSQVGVKGIICTNNMDKSIHKELHPYINRLINYQLGYDVSMDELSYAQAAFIPRRSTNELHINKDASFLDIDKDVIVEIYENKKQIEQQKLINSNAIKADPSSGDLLNQLLDHSLTELGEYDFRNNVRLKFAGKAKYHGFDVEQALDCVRGRGLLNNEREQQFRSIFNTSPATPRVIVNAPVETGHLEKLKMAKQQRKQLKAPTAPVFIYDDKVEIEKQTYFKLLSINKQQYVSDALDTDIHEWSSNNIIIAAPGTGKTRYVIDYSKKHKSVLVVPTQSMVEELVNKHGGSPFYHKVKNTSGNLIITTYASFPSLCNEINCKDYVLWLDECHNFVSSSDETFMYKQLKNVLECVPKFNYVNALTGTYLDLRDIKGLPNWNSVILVEKETTCVTGFETLYTKNVIIETVKRVVESIKNDHQVIVFLNNKDTQSSYGTLTELLREDGINFVSINSSTKTSDGYEQIIKRGNAMGQVIIATSVLKEGNSITEHLPVVDCFVLYQWSDIEIVQMSQRFRNAKQINIVNLKTVPVLTEEENEWYADIDSFLDLEDVYDQSQRDIQIARAMYYNTMINEKGGKHKIAYQVKSNAYWNIGRPIYGLIFDEEKKEPVYCSMLCQNMIYQKNKIISNNVPSLRKLFMEENGIVYKDDKYIDTPPIDETSLMDIKEKKIARKKVDEMIKKQVIDGVLSNCTNINELNSYALNHKSGSKEIRYIETIIKLMSNASFDNVKGAVEYLDEINWSNEKLNHFLRQCTNRKARDVGNKDAMLIDQVFRIGDRLTSDEICQKLKACSLVTKFDDNSSKAIAYLKTWFDISRVERHVKNTSKQYVYIIDAVV